MSNLLTLYDMPPPNQELCLADTPLGTARTVPTAIVDSNHAALQQPFARCIDGSRNDENGIAERRLGAKQQIALDIEHL